MSNNKQSSVEWLQLALEHTILTHEQTMQTIGLFEQAKAMHKEEVKEAWDNVAIDATYGNKFRNFEEFYNETFGGNND